MCRGTDHFVFGVVRPVFGCSSEPLNDSIIRRCVPEPTSSGVQPWRRYGTNEARIGACRVRGWSHGSIRRWAVKNRTVRHWKTLLFGNLRIEMNVFDDGTECRIEVNPCGKVFHGKYRTADSLPGAKRLAVEWAMSEAKQPLDIHMIGRYSSAKWDVFRGYD